MQGGSSRNPEAERQGALPVSFQVGSSCTNRAELGSCWGLGWWEGGGQSHVVRVGTDK